MGAKKIFFLIRDIDGPTTAAVSMESCQSVAPRSPWRHLGSVVDVRKRLHRMRGGFHRCTHISKVLCALMLWMMKVDATALRMNSMGSSDCARNMGSESVSTHPAQ